MDGHRSPQGRAGSRSQLDPRLAEEVAALLGVPTSHLRQVHEVAPGVGIVVEALMIAVQLPLAKNVKAERAKPPSEGRMAHIRPFKGATSAFLALSRRFWVA